MEVSGLSSPTILSNSASDSSADFARPLSAQGGQSNTPKPIVLRTKFLQHLFGAAELLQDRFVALSFYTDRAFEIAKKEGHVLYDRERDEVVGRLAKAYALLCEAGNLPFEIIPEKLHQTTWLSYVQLVAAYEHGAPVPEWLDRVNLWLMMAPHLSVHPEGLLFEPPMRLDSNRVLTVDPTDARAEGDTQL